MPHNFMRNCKALIGTNQLPATVTALILQKL